MDMNADLIDKLVVMSMEKPEKYKKYIEHFSRVIGDLITLLEKTNK